MDSRTLRLMVTLARNQEQRMAEQVRAAHAKVLRGQQLQQQLERFGDDYGQAAMDAARSGGLAGFVADAQAFGRRLHRTAADQEAAIAAQAARRDTAQRALVQCQHRVEALQSVLTKALRKEAAQATRRAEAALDDAVAARHQREGGTKSAGKIRKAIEP